MRKSGGKGEQILTLEESKDAELAFDLFKESHDQTILEKDIFLNAFKFYLQLYYDVAESIRVEIIHHIQKTHQSQLNHAYFTNLITKLKLSNGGLTKRDPVELNKNFIMKHLDEKQIVFIDRCWGKFDSMKYGYIVSGEVRSCINMILQKFNTQCLDYNPFTSYEDTRTVCSPSLGHIKQIQNDSIDQRQTKEEGAKNNHADSNEVNDWILNQETQIAVSFEVFANFISQVIVDNKLKFKATSASCQSCAIF